VVWVEAWVLLQPLILALMMSLTKILRTVANALSSTNSCQTEYWCDEFVKIIEYKKK
jgi:hypothetical protein